MMNSEQDMTKKLQNEEYELIPMPYIGPQKIGQKDQNGDFSSQLCYLTYKPKMYQMKWRL